MTTKADEKFAGGDRELMRHLDGELEPHEAREIERLLSDDATARDKRAGLLLVGEILRERVDGDTRGDGIADAVMARLDEAADLPPLEGLDEAAEETVEGGADAVYAAGAAPLQVGGEPSAKPANDNARIIFTLAAGAAAAAAVLFFWGKTEPDDTVALAPPPEAPPAEVAPAPVEPPPAPTAEAEPEEAPAPVEVAAVDFGSQSGSVFYVSGENAATAVVWVTGGEQP